VEVRKNFVSFLTTDAPLYWNHSDEVAALVVDIGSSSLRAGYAGDDTPKAVIPTSYGFHRASRDGDVSMTDITENGEARVKPKFSKIYVGSSGPSVWREGMELASPVFEGLSACLFYYLSKINSYQLVSRSPGL
jgi:actin-like protein 6A